MGYEPPHLVPRLDLWVRSSPRMFYRSFILNRDCSWCVELHNSPRWMEGGYFPIRPSFSLSSLGLLSLRIWSRPSTSDHLVFLLGLGFMTYEAYSGDHTLHFSYDLCVIIIFLGLFCLNNKYLKTKWQLHFKKCET